MPVRTPVEIFGTPHSNFVRAVRVAIAEKGLPYDYYPVRPHSPEARAVHPLGLVPGLRHGEVEVLGESQAIIAYLDGLWADRPMGPSGSVAEAAGITQWISIVASAVDQTLIRRYVVPYVPSPRAPTARPTARRSKPCCPTYARSSRCWRRGSTAATGMAANRFTFADALLLATLNPALRRTGSSRDRGRKRPAVRRYFALHSQRRSFVETAPAPPEGLPATVLAEGP